MTKMGQMTKLGKKNCQMGQNDQKWPELAGQLSLTQQMFPKLSPKIDQNSKMAISRKMASQVVIMQTDRPFPPEIRLEGPINL